MDVTSEALKHQEAAGLLIIWRAHEAVASISAATIRMRRQQRSTQRRPMQKWEQEKLLKSKTLNQPTNKKTVVLLFPQSMSWIKNSYKYRKISVQLLFHIRMCCRNSLDVLDWGNDTTKGITVKMKVIQPLWTQECSWSTKEDVQWEKIFAEPHTSPPGTPNFLL